MLLTVCFLLYWMSQGMLILALDLTFKTDLLVCFNLAAEISLNSILLLFCHFQDSLFLVIGLNSRFERVAVIILVVDWHC